MNANSTNFLLCKQILIEEIVNKFDVNKNNLVLNLNTDSNNSSEYIKEIQIIDRNPKMMVYKVFEQRHGALCGYHCLFNLITLSKYFKNNEISKKNYYLQKLNNVAKFWIFYRRIKNYLLKNIKLDDKMRTSMINMGPLERYQFQFVLDKNEKIKKIIETNKDIEIKIYRLFYGFEIIQSTSRAEIIELQKALDRMKNETPEKNLVYFILLGITNHWSMLVLIKEKQSSEVQFMYFDSLNLNIFGLADEDEIETFVEKRNQEKIKNGKNPFTPFLRRIFAQWIKDINSILRILYKIIYDNYSLFDMIVTYTVERMLKTYEESMKLNLDNLEINDAVIENISANEESLILWLKSEYHPQILTDEIHRMIDNYNYVSKIKTKSFYKNLLTWIILNKMYLVVLNNSNKLTTCYDDKLNEVLLKRFSEFLNDFSRLLCI